MGALSHVRICDFTGQLAGAGATRTLAAFGAEVIRIEDPVTRGGWDILRGMSPFVDERRGIELGGGFQNHNVEKLGITLNLRTERGKALLRRLVAISDVVAENFAAGVLARLGFPYEVLREIRPDVVYVSNCGFGQRGPYCSLQDLGPDRPGRVRAQRQLGAAGRAARRVGLLVHGPPGRQPDGPRDPGRPRASRPHRRGPVGRHVVHRRRRGAARVRWCSTTR